MTAATLGRKRAFAILVAGALAYTWLMFVWFALPAYLPAVIEDLSLSDTQAGIVVGAVPLTYIPLALFSGLFVDRVGPGRSLALGTLVFGCAQLARSGATGFGSVLVATVLIGVGATAITFGLPKLVSELFPPERTGFPSSVYLVAANAGSAAAFALGRPVLGPLLGGWRPLFFWSGVGAVAYGLVWTVLVWTVGVDTSDAGEAAAATAAGIVADLRTVLAHRELQLLVAIGTMYLLVVHGTQGWLPTLLETRGMSTGRAGVTTSGFVAAVVVGILTVPAAADHLGRRRIALSACGVCITIGIGGVLLAGGTVLRTGAVLLAGFGAGGISPLLRAIPPSLDGIGSRRTGTAVGFVFAVGEVGGFLGPVLIGAARGATGSFVPGFGILAAAGLVVIYLGIVLARSTRDT